jgi:hypothetical protein
MVDKFHNLRPGEVLKINESDMANHTFMPIQVVSELRPGKILKKPTGPFFEYPAVKEDCFKEDLEEDEDFQLLQEHMNLSARYRASLSVEEIRADIVKMSNLLKCVSIANNFDPDDLLAGLSTEDLANIGLQRLVSP